MEYGTLDMFIKAYIYRVIKGISITFKLYEILVLRVKITIFIIKIQKI